MATTGKSYRGQAFFPIKTEVDVQAELDAQKPYASKPDAMPINVWMNIRQIRDPVMRAAMEAFTKVRHATQEDWDLLFKDF